MVRTLWISPLCLLILVFCLSNANAQTGGKNQDDAVMADISALLQLRFIIDTPDAGFVYSRDGKGVRYSQENLKIRTSIFTVPAVYGKMMEEARKQINIPGYTFLDSAHVKSISGHNGFRTIQEVVAQDPGIYDVQIVISTAFEYKGYSVLVTSVYPKTLDKEWRQKLIASSLTIREEKN
jgi:hypothetical protein